MVNGVALRQDVLDREVLSSIADALQPMILERAVEKALAKLAHARAHHATRRSQAERELQEVQRKVDRLVDVLADGSLPADETKARLTAGKACKTALQAELTKLEQVPQVVSLDTGHLKRSLQERGSDVTALLGHHIVQVPDDHPLKARENVFAFSLALTLAPLDQSNPGAQLYHFVGGFMEEPQYGGCHDDCLFPSLIARGDGLWRQHYCAEIRSPRF